MPAMNDRSEFYVGYEAAAPPGIARRIRLAVVTLGFLVAATGVLLVLGQHPFEPARFEFQQYRDHEGRFFAWPHPLLRTPAGDFLLAGEGKHGIGNEIPSAANGRMVRVKGALIENGANRMLELLPRSASVGGTDSAPAPITRLGPATFSGEIVDTKCHFGVMNPGQGKVHRQCAARCLSGGIPPGLLVRDSTGAARVFLLIGRHGSPLPVERLMDHAAELVTIAGDVLQSGSLWVLETEAAAIRRE